MLLRLTPLALLLSVVGCENPTGPERPIEGKVIFNRHCARCHGMDGTGSKEAPSAKDLTNKAYLDRFTDDQLRMVIDNGRPPAMPGFRGEFAEPTLKVLIAYVRSLSDPSAGVVDPSPESQ